MRSVNRDLSHRINHGPLASEMISERIPAPNAAPQSEVPSGPPFNTEVSSPTGNDQMAAALSAEPAQRFLADRTQARKVWPRSAKVWRRKLAKSEFDAVHSRLSPGIETSPLNTHSKGGEASASIGPSVYAVRIRRRAARSSCDNAR